ncbi:MAG: hypothetical protein K2X50_09010 [Gammaproteobacteria bacterium]|nr:hypothetical protein [Gammaproteobacteria bacterium]
MTAKKIDICIAVHAGFWIGDHNLQRTEQAIKELYEKLFVATNNNDTTKATAQSVWYSIIDNPESPDGPLTLAAISQALLMSADFSDSEDRLAFFEFMKHNKMFQILFRFFILEDHSGYTSQQYDEELAGLFKQIFSKPVSSHEQFPDIAAKDGKIPLVPFRVSQGFLSAVQIGSFSSSEMPDEINRLKHIWISLGKNGLRQKILKAMGENESFVFDLLKTIPAITKSLSFERLQVLSRHYPGMILAAASGFESRAVSLINEILRSIANLRFSAIQKTGIQIYQPFAIKKMSLFWRENFEVFQTAAGEKDQHLTRLLSHMKDPIAFVMSMLQKKSADENEENLLKRREYFVRRIGKIMPVLGRQSGKRAQKALNALLSVNLTAGNKSGSLVQHLKDKVSQLIEEYSKTGVDPDDQLFDLLNDDVSREKCKLTAGQVKKLLEREINRTGEPRCFNSRFEAIIARDESLTKLIARPDQQEASVFQLHHPWLAARNTIDEALEKYGDLGNYFQNKPKAASVTMQQAFLMASKLQLWSQIDPYAINPVWAFFHWLNPNWCKDFFTEEENKLASINPLFKLRLNWQRVKSKNLKSFEECIVQSKEDGFEELVADIAHDASSLNHSAFEKQKTAYGEALLSNPCRFDAFVAQINTPVMASAHESFLLDDTAVKMITSEQVSRLMTMDECDSSDLTSCAQLAAKIIIKRPQLIIDIISKEELRRQFSGGSKELMLKIAGMVEKRRSFLSEFLDNITVILGQYNQQQLDEDLTIILSSEAAPLDLTLAELQKIQDVSPRAIKFLLGNEKFSSNIPSELRDQVQRVDQKDHDNLMLAKKLSGQVEPQRFVGGKYASSYANGLGVKGAVNIYDIGSDVGLASLRN